MLPVGCLSGRADPRESAVEVKSALLLERVGADTSRFTVRYSTRVKTNGSTFYIMILKKKNQPDEPIFDFLPERFYLLRSICRA